MTAGRFGGDRFVQRVGGRNALVAGAIASAGGLALVAFAPGAGAALAGFALVGLGSANVVPVLFTAAGRQTAMPESLAVPAMTTIGYAGLLAGPAGIGAIARAVVVADRVRGARAADDRRRRDRTTRAAVTDTFASGGGAWLAICGLGLAAGCVGGVIGTGSSIILLPVLVFVFGPKEAVPIMAVASVMGNLARVLAWWRDVDWRAVAWYVVPGVPAAALGARTLLALPSSVIDVALGTFFLAMIPLRRRRADRRGTLRPWHLAVAGAIIGYVTGVVLSTGPLSVPVFAAYGLVGGAFLSTEAASSLCLYVTKVATFRELGALPAATFARGVVVGTSLMAGTFAGKAVVRRLSVHVFGRVLDGVMLVAGVAMIVDGLRGAG